MSKAAASLRALTGPARLLLLVVVAWVAVWGSIWGYTSFRLAEVQGWIDQAIAEPVTEDTNRRIGQYVDKWNRIYDWQDRAKWIGPIGFASILFFGIGGNWVFRGFRKPFSSVTH
jgi:hypothetical protein